MYSSWGHSRRRQSWRLLCPCIGPRQTFCFVEKKKSGDNYFAILQHQRDIAHAIPDIPLLEPVSEKGWNPLQLYDHRHEKTHVFDPEWKDVDVRGFRDLGGDEKDRILVENIAAIDCAKPGQTIYIINCYVIITQALQESYLFR